jgi:hypothetical protein
LAIVVTRTKSDESGSVVEEATHVPEWLKSGICIREHASVLVVVQPLRYLTSGHIDDQPNASEVIRDDSIPSAIAHQIFWHIDAQPIDEAASNVSVRVQLATRADSLAPRVGKAFDQRLGRAYLTKLQAAKRDFALVQDSLARFRVLSASLRQSDGFMGLESAILLTIANETGHSISRAYFSALSQSPGREIPWITDTFNYTIPGGLAPGEHATWSLKAQHVRRLLEQGARAAGRPIHRERDEARWPRR